jgi:hypothetical protein
MRATPGEPADVIRLFQRFQIAGIVVLLLGAVGGAGCFLLAWLIVVTATNEDANGAAAVMGATGVLDVIACGHVGWGMCSLWRRQPRWVIESDRLVFVENEADELAEIPFEAIDRVELWKLVGAAHVNVILGRPLDWARHLPKRFFPMVRRRPGGNWTSLIHTARESPPDILERIQIKLAAFQRRRVLGSETRP